MSAFPDTLLGLDETFLLAPPKSKAESAPPTMMRFDQMPFAQLTLIGAACVLLAGCPSNGSSPASGTSAVASAPAPSSGGTSTTTGKTPSGGGGSSGSGSSTTPPPPPPPTQSVTLSWSAPTLNTNGTILNDLAGYYINYGTSATALSQTVTVTGATSTTYTVANLVPGTYYFSVTAYSSAGTESAPSPTVSKTI